MTRGAHNRVWTSARFKTAIPVLRRSRTMSEAVATLRELGGHWASVTTVALTDGFRRYAPHSASHYLATGVALDPEVALNDVRSEVARRQRVSDDRTALRAALDRTAVLEGQVAVLSRPLAVVEPIERPPPSRAGRQACAVAMLSDVHAGAVVLPDKSTYWNWYDQTICVMRLRRWFDGVEWLINSYRDGTGSYAWKIEQLLVAGLGDIVDGHLHEDQQETSQTTIETLTWLEPELVAGFERLAKLKFSRMILDWNYGNHGRDTVKPRRSTGAVHSHEWGLGVRLERWLRSSRIDVIAKPKSHHYIDVFGHELHTHHGDEIKYAGGVGGISIPINKAVAQWNRVSRSRYHLFGHYHQQLDGGDWFCNGSIVGYNDYAMSIKATPEAPQQTFFLLDSVRGKTAVSPIWVSDYAAERKAWGTSHSLEGLEVPPWETAASR